MRYQAIQDGQGTWAEKRNGRWLVGGDRPSGKVSILMQRDGRDAWFRLLGCVVKFEDWN